MKKKYVLTGTIKCPECDNNIDLEIIITKGDLTYYKDIKFDDNNHVSCPNCNNYFCLSSQIKIKRR